MNNDFAFQRSISDTRLTWAEVVGGSGVLKDRLIHPAFLITQLFGFSQWRAVLEIRASVNLDEHCGKVVISLDHV